MLNPRFRIISNGFGEDLIASKLIQSFRDCYDFDFDVFPLVGQGNAYKHIGMNPKLDQNVLPSGGFLLKINDIVSDLNQVYFPSLGSNVICLNHQFRTIKLLLGMSMLFLWLRLVYRSQLFFFLLQNLNERFHI